MRIAALVRVKSVDLAAMRMSKFLSDYFGENIFFFEEHYDDPISEALVQDGNIIRVGGRFLSENQLAVFPRAGWQCGDYMYYAAAVALPDFDAFWMLETDVHFAMPSASTFFGPTEILTYDFLIPHFGGRTSEWQWFNTMSELCEKIFGGLFPVTRISRDAAIHLFEMRKQYCNAEGLAEKSYGIGHNINFANDEVFACSTLMRDGFSCGSLSGLLPENFGNSFSTSVPFLEAELSAPELRNKVVHPVCGLGKAGNLLRQLNLTNNVRFIERKNEIIMRCGEKIWNDLLME